MVQPQRVSHAPATVPNPQYATMHTNPPRLPVVQQPQPVQPPPPPPMSPVQPPLPQAPPVVPNHTSSPKPIVDMPAYSPISDPGLPAVDNNNNDSGNASKSNIVMSDTSVQPSMSSSLAYTLNLNKQSRILSSHDMQCNSTSEDVQVIDTDVTENDPNLVINDSSQKPVVKIENVSQNDVKSNDIQVLTKKQFPDNVSPLEPISIPRRITTAYKYYPFVRSGVPQKKPRSEAHGIDEVPKAKEEIVENSFPMASLIKASWQDQGKSFRNSMKDALIMPDEPSDLPDKNDPEATNNTESGDSQGAPKPKLFCKVPPNLLKNRPPKKQGDFYYHNMTFSPFVEFEHNIDILTPSGFDVSNYKFNVNLAEDEVKNIQYALSYGLQAESHANSYVSASHCAINQALLHLDPKTHADEITALHDAKYMLSGAANALEQSVKMMIYPHAGLTAIIRSDFLKAIGDTVPVHVKQGLLFENFGGTGLFNSKIDKYRADIELHQNKLHQASLSTAVQKSLNNNSQSRNSGHPSAPPVQVNNSGGFNTPRGQGRGRSQHGGQNRGRGNSTPFHQKKQPFPRNSNHKGGRGNQNNNRGNNKRGGRGKN